VIVGVWGKERLSQARRIGKIKQIDGKEHQRPVILYWMKLALLLLEV
jgi:hypothetical protein